MSDKKIELFKKIGIFKMGYLRNFLDDVIIKTIAKDIINTMLAIDPDFNPEPLYQIYGLTYEKTPDEHRPLKTGLGARL